MGGPDNTKAIVFFANNSLIIDFKGIVMKLKNVAHTISVEKPFFDVVQLSYKP